MLKAGCQNDIITSFRASQGLENPFTQEHQVNQSCRPQTLERSVRLQEVNSRTQTEKLRKFSFHLVLLHLCTIHTVGGVSSKTINNSDSHS